LLLKQRHWSLHCGEDTRKASHHMHQMSGDLDGSRRRHQMLLWCKLFRDTSRPWSPREPQPLPKTSSMLGTRVALDRFSTGADTQFGSFPRTVGNERSCRV
jgi:hypothetical protein